MGRYLLPWIVASSGWIIFTSVVISGVQGGETTGYITCECTTTRCIQQGVSACTTGGLCFVQYLDRGGVGGKGDVLVRGCTEGRTPLLCENRKPSRVKTWPLLHCCGTDLCNRDALPTPSRADAQQIAFKTLQELHRTLHGTNHSSDVIADGTTTATLPVAPSLGRGENEDASTPPLPQQQQRRRPWPHIVGPVYVSVLVLGVVSLVIIGVVAAAVIRKSNRFYADHHYGTLQFRRGKTGAVAEHVVHCDCDIDSEVESVASSLSYLHMVRPGRNT